MLITPDHTLWTPERRELWTPDAPAGRTRRRGGFIAPDRGLRQNPLYAAITRTFIGFVASGTNAAAYNLTMSNQPTTDRLQIVSVVNTIGSGTAIMPTSITGNGLTYTNVNTLTFSSGSVGVRISNWVAAGTTTGSGQIAVSFGGATQTSCVAVANEFPGASATGAGAGSNAPSHSAGDYTSTLSYAGGSDSRPYVAMTDMVNASDWSALTGWTAIGAGFQGSPANNLQAFWRSDLADATVGATHATTSNVALLALELVATATASAVMRRTLSNIGTRTGARQGR